MFKNYMLIFVYCSKYILELPGFLDFKSGENKKSPKEYTESEIFENVDFLISLEKT